MVDFVGGKKQQSARKEVLWKNGCRPIEGDRSIDRLLWLSEAARCSGCAVPLGSRAGLPSPGSELRGLPVALNRSIACLHGTTLKCSNSKLREGNVLLEFQRSLLKHTHTRTHFLTPCGSDCRSSAGHLDSVLLLFTLPPMNGPGDIGAQKEKMYPGGGPFSDLGTCLAD